MDYYVMLEFWIVVKGCLDFDVGFEHKQIDGMVMPIQSVLMLPDFMNYL